MGTSNVEYGVGLQPGSYVRDHEDIERVPLGAGGLSMYKSRMEGNDFEAKRVGELAANEKKELLFECFERICLMAMENERLFGKCTRLGEENNEKRRELEIYKGRCENLEKSKSFDGMNEERLIALRHERDKLDDKLRETTRELDNLRNKVFEFEVQIANLHNIEADYRRAHKEKTDLELMNQNLLKERDTLYWENEQLKDGERNNASSFGEVKRSFEDKIRLLAIENERLSEYCTRGGDLERKYKDSMAELESNRTQLLFRNEQYGNLEKKLDEAERQLRMVALENQKISKALSETDGERSVLKDGLKRLEL